MRLLKLVYLGLGVGLLAVVLRAFDFGAALALVAQVGLAGFLAVLAVAIVFITLGSVAWQLTLPALPIDLLWIARLWKVRVVGEAFNRVLPAGTLGGEPLKAMLLKKHYDISYREGVVSLYLIRTIDLAGLVLFASCAAGLVLASARLELPYKLSVVLGVIVLAGMFASLFLLPRSRLSARLGRFLQRRSWGSAVAERLRHLAEIEDRIVRFRRLHPRRFNAALFLSVLRWGPGSLEVYLTFWMLGHPVGIVEAFMIEGVLQLVRSVTFFIPANLGSQEGAYVLFSTALTGFASAGLGAAIVRRIRELVVLVIGFAVGAQMAIPTGTRRTL